MIIPEDGCLPQITRKGFAAFNNVMIIRVPDNLKKPGETSFQFATLDTTKKGERWPADQYVNILLNTKDNNSAENLSHSDENKTKNNAENCKKFFIKQVRPISKKKKEASHSAASDETVNFSHNLMPNDFQSSHRGMHRENSFQYNERNFNDNHNYRYGPKRLPIDHQPYSGQHNIYGEGSSSMNHNENFTARGRNISTANSRESIMQIRPYDRDFTTDTANNRMISPDKPPLIDYPRNPPLFPKAFVPQNQNFIDINRDPEEPFIPSALSTNNFNAVPRCGNFERSIFPHNGEEIMNNADFNMPPYRESYEPELNNSFNNKNHPRPPLLFTPHPPTLYADFDNNPNGDYQNYNVRNPNFHSEMWNEHDSHYQRENGTRRHAKPWRERRHNNRRNNRYQRGKK